MSFYENLITAIGILVGLILLCTGLRKAGVVKEEHGGVFARLVTEFTLPALIFTALSSHPVEFKRLLLPAVLLVAEIACGLTAWGVAVLCRLSNPRKGAVILASTFGSSAFLGYAVVKNVFQADDNALAEAAIASEIGVGLPIFTVGVLIAIHFGKNGVSREQKLADMTRFFRSPIFVALILGSLFSFVSIPKDNVFVSGILQFLHIIAGANTIFVVLSIGLMLYFRDFRKVILPVAIACSIKLLLQPCIASGAGHLLSFPEKWYQLIVLEASMPAAALSAVYAKRYGCDSELTSILVFTTLVSSLFSIIAIFFFLG